jgi:hypothetical protein
MKTRRPWRTTLHLHSTSLEVFTSEERITSWCVHLEGSPLVFIGLAQQLSTGKIAEFTWNRHWGGLWKRHVEGERQWSVGWFGSAELALAPTNFIFCRVTIWWTLVSLVDDSTEVRLVCFDCGPSNPCDACMLARDWLRLFSLDQRMCFLHFLPNFWHFHQGHVEYRGFISSMCIRNASSFLFVVKLTRIFSVMSVKKIPQATLCSSRAKLGLGCWSGVATISHLFIIPHLQQNILPCFE